MAEIIISQIMDGIAAAIRSAGITKSVYPWPVESITVPCAVVGYPTVVEFDSTMGRGSDSASFPVYFMVGKAHDRSARDALTGIVKQMKNALDDALGTYALRVIGADISEITVAGVNYLAAIFTLEVTT